MAEDNGIMLKPYNIAKYTLISCIAGGSLTAGYEWTRTYGEAYNALRNEAETGAGSSRVMDQSTGGGRTRRLRGPIPLLAGSAALNSGLIAFGFFSLREYLVSPTLQGLRASPGDFRDAVTWGDLRTRNLLESSIAGAMVGAAINAFKRGAAGMPAGAITASVACSIAQVAYNEANIQRVKYASRAGIASQPVVDSGLESHPRKSWLDRALYLFGVTRATDEEYLQKLKIQRERLLKRIEELESEKGEGLLDDSPLKDERGSSS